MSDSFTAPPGGMSYDADRQPRKTNAECPLCWRAFWRNPEDTGTLCDRCSSAADWRAQERKRMAKADLKPAAEKKGQL